MTPGILEFSFVIAIAAFLGAAARLLKQPVLLAYLATGAVITSLGLFNLSDHETFHTLSELGIMFLLFLVGLEINYTQLRLVGKAALTVGVAQVLCTSLLGFFISHTFLGFGTLESFFIGIALTFSSTIIVVKLISDKKEMGSLYAKIAIGMLLVQDFVAIVLLILLPGISSNGSFAVQEALGATFEGLALLAVMVFLGRTVLPRLFDLVAKSEEVLFLMSLAWLFILAAGLQKIGLSIEIAGFLAGIALANSAERFQIGSRIKPLRDFFMLIFFAILGSSLVQFDFHGLTLSIIVLSAFVLVGNPLIVLVAMGMMGYRKRTSFLTGITVSQISEFSLVLVALGAKMGHVSQAVVSLVTAVGIVTIVISSYLIIYSDAIFRRLRRALSLFERRHPNEHGIPSEEVRRPIVIIGGHRTGQSIAQSLPKKDLLIVDFDPEIVQHFTSQGVSCLFGDIADPDIFERAHVEDASLVISTSPDVEDNLGLVHALKSRSQKTARVVVRAENEQEAARLYGAGADYVIVPHVTSGHYLGKTIAIDPEMKMLDQLRKRDQKMMASPMFSLKK